MSQKGDALLQEESADEFRVHAGFCSKAMAQSRFSQGENKRILQLLIVDFGGDEFGGGADNAQP